MCTFIRLLLRRALMALFKSCIVARTKENLERVADACRALQPNGSDGVNKVLSYAGDISNPDDMIAVRDLIVKGMWNRIAVA